MRLILRGHTSKYPVEQAMLLFFPEERPVFCDDYDDYGDAAVSTLTVSGQSAVCVTDINYRGKRANARAEFPVCDMQDRFAYERVLRNVIKESFCQAAAEICGGMPPWGTLTGIRPAKIAASALRENGLPEYADRVLRDTYHVCQSRRELCIDCALESERVRALLRPRDIALYIGIPFCPTRCGYCTFVSHSVEKAAHLIEPYLDALEKEIVHAAALVRELGLTVRAAYIGGGTPTSLSAGQLERLFELLEREFALSEASEYTVEAGRPDTLDDARLLAVKKSGAGRISINPQTLSDKILQNIGRPHTGEDALEAFSRARALGFGSVNMDVIAGLPGDTPEYFSETIDRLVALAPENITVHTLSLKKGSNITLSRTALPQPGVVAAMLDYAGAALRNSNYSPYYLYRQKFMAAALENTGWTLPGHTGIYNICMMEELCTVLAIGAGGVTKLVDATGQRIERIFNAKYPYEYIAGIDGIIEKKLYFSDFFARFGA